MGVGTRRTVSGEPVISSFLAGYPAGRLWEPHHTWLSRINTVRATGECIVKSPGGGGGGGRTKKGASREGGAARGSISLQEARAKIEDGKGVVSMLKLFH